MATVIFKPTEACNGRCAYCDVVRKKPRTPTMSAETLEIFFCRINEFLLERPQEHMEIIWHGGEPLLLGPDFFSQALSFQEKHCPKTCDRIRHDMQSNLTLFSRKFAEILGKLGIRSIGTSYDPIGDIRGLGPKRDSKTYNKRFMEALRLVEEEGFSWGVIYVVTRRSLAKPLEVFQFLSNLSPKGSFMFNPVLLYGGDPWQLKITPEEYAHFLGAIFPVWWKRREQYGQVEPFFSLTRNLLEGSPSLMCCDSGACAHTHLNLLPDGSLSHCGRSGDWGLLPYGSVFDKSFSQVFADPQRAALLERNKVLPKGECKGCRFWNICHGGCPLDSWSHSGSFLHKTEWCAAKRDLIEQYFEPTVRGESAVAEPAQAENALHLQGTKVAGKRQLEPAMGNGDLLWINPVGGLGDTLMISGVLKQVVEQDPSRQFNLVSRTKYPPLLKGHPAIAHIGHPPPGAGFIGTNYWDQEDYKLHGKRAYQVLARMFGIATPVPELLYIPWTPEDDPVLPGLIPWKKRNVLVCQSSDSPRKQMALDRWESLVEVLNRDGIGIVQAGRMRDRYIRGAHSLLGLTTPRQLISLVGRFNAVVTSDNFIMHAAHLCGIPAVVLWGPTDHRVYGYSGQVHLQADVNCEYAKGCIGKGSADSYQTDCPEGDGHCMNGLSLKIIYKAIRGLL
ncbi:MAG: SPASM domain-containing protein [Armatimonadetes bacterium]|nr:SPASM domain-containing protein [Armatimonadota bacterium]